MVAKKVQKRLATLFSEYPTGVILDEPTTHLDKEHRQLLVADLTYYYGTVLFVSHDRFFLNQLAEKIWEVSDGHVKRIFRKLRCLLSSKRIGTANTI